MSALVIQGKEAARSIRTRVRETVDSIFSEKAPRLVSLLVGSEDPSSKVYLANQKKTAAKVGIEYRQVELSGKAEENEILQVIEEMNEDPETHGILIQRPLPSHLDPLGLILAVHPDKDVEGLHPVNLGAIAHGRPRLVPCTAEAAIRLFRSTDRPVKGLEVVVVGHSEIVGKPIALLLVHELATVTICHIGTKDLSSHTRRADVLFVATGVPGLIQADAVKPGAVVIDIGINAVEVEEGGKKTTRIVGDVDFEGVANVAGAITPVPGGVGPVTTAILMENTLKAALYQKGQAGRG
ncbi:MAG: bifunctional 5,10-methylenetetrahydrofolate dehydrogenase/5,10-methenyltetrahydrofolate cyclohydrolase [Planctomycetota bacterium]